MNTKLILPFALISALTLAACESRTEAPETPNPDAGNPEAFAEPVEEPDAPAETMSPEEMQQRREEIEQDAQQTFESIMEDSQEAGDTIVEMGDDAMSALSEQMTSAGDAIEVQIDTLVDNAAQMRDDNMTDEQKLQVVANVRSAAEEAARALGQTAPEVIAAGDTAEERARQVLGLE
ncbi:hypothetical protein [Pelagibacterium halotolerans]|uniref:Uncharacterized protein n=1 Tax=Pelagibacterium halotolerans (strain DSM 22347 / JCM 15775 / CGMCC 1.7692 / B2) TaxID=1082931 RepID=G4R6J9_PELHB|nr:hypothetical protein [Pelagibacterium halotolerans]AEQ51195.1 hypothetical protein KKY_1163 [Pelagibacterium halotolerans B2]QJR18941.1 hypothetical protein HKM20_11115 [Pelagibacterium halotolerans]